MTLNRESWLALPPLLFMFALGIWTYHVLPDNALVPVHWNAASQPDRFASKHVGLFVLPGAALVSVLFMSLSRTFAARQENVRNSAKPWRIIMLGSLYLMTTAYICQISYILGHDVNVGRVTMAALGLMMLVVGNYLGKLHSNFFVGIRTPWTLRSEMIWNKTHRFAGKISVAAGLTAMLCSIFLSLPYLGVIIIALIIATYGTATLYSWILWRRQPKP